MRVFFYGLFMDESLLATKGIKPTDVSVGFVGGYGLRIGERATLVRRPNGRAYGAMMDIAASEATCYNLPSAKVTGTNKVYAESLLQVASRLGLPDSYLDEIRRARK